MRDGDVGGAQLLLVKTGVGPGAYALRRLQRLFRLTPPYRVEPARVNRESIAALEVGARFFVAALRVEHAAQRELRTGVERIACHGFLHYRGGTFDVAELGQG